MQMYSGALVYAQGAGGLGSSERHAGPCSDVLCLLCSPLQVITVNQVVDILVRKQTNPDWADVLAGVLPGRKVVGLTAAAGAADGKAEPAETGDAKAEAQEGKPKQQVSVTENAERSSNGDVSGENPAT